MAQCKLQPYSQTHFSYKARVLLMISKTKVYREASHCHIKTKFALSFLSCGRGEVGAELGGVEGGNRGRDVLYERTIYFNKKYTLRHPNISVFILVLVCLCTNSQAEISPMGCMSRCSSVVTACCLLGL